MAALVARRAGWCRGVFSVVSGLRILYQHTSSNCVKLRFLVFYFTATRFWHLANEVRHAMMIELCTQDIVLKMSLLGRLV